MSNKLFQGVIHQMKDKINRVIGVVDERGSIISCSELPKIGEIRQKLRDELIGNELSVVSGYTYRPIGSSIHPEFSVFVEGEDSLAEKMSAILAISLLNIKSLYDERNDKNSLIKNIILDNILPSDVYVKAKELYFSLDTPRAVFLIKFSNKNDVVSYDMIQNLFPDKDRDHVVNISEQSIALVKEVKSDIRIEELEEIAHSIADTLSSEFYVKVFIGVGSVVTNVKLLARSFKEAMMFLVIVSSSATALTLYSFCINWASDWPLCNL